MNPGQLRAENERRQLLGRLDRVRDRMMAMKIQQYERRATTERDPHLAGLYAEAVYALRAFGQIPPHVGLCLPEENPK